MSALTLVIFSVLATAGAGLGLLGLSAAGVAFRQIRTLEERIEKLDKKGRHELYYRGEKIS